MSISKYDSDDILSSFNSIGLRDIKYKNIVIHSSIGRLGLLYRDNPKNLLIKIIDYFGKNKTLFFPTFTYSFRRNEIFYLNKINSSLKNEMGVLSYEAISSKLGFRNNCPLFSYYIIGKNAEKYKDRNDNDCFSKSNLFGRFFEEKSIFLGIGISYSNGLSPFMYLEKLSKVPYRKNLLLKGKVFNESNKNLEISEAIHFARDEINYPNLVVNRNEIGKALEKLKISRITYLNKRSIYAIESEPFKNYVLKKLRQDPFCMTNKSSIKYT